MSSQEIKRQISELASKAAPVFHREGFKKYAMWAGIFGPLSYSVPAVKCSVDVVIFYNPKISESEVWDNYYRDVDEYDWLKEPDEPKLTQVWNRKVGVLRIIEGTLYCRDHIKAIFQAQTIYGDFNNPAFQKLRSFYYGQLEKRWKRVKECREIANLRKKADGSMVRNPLIDISV
jgi:hypothetical protein